MICNGFKLKQRVCVVVQKVLYHETVESYSAIEEFPEDLRLLSLHVIFSLVFLVVVYTQEVSRSCRKVRKAQEDRHTLQQAPSAVSLFICPETNKQPPQTLNWPGVCKRTPLSTSAAPEKGGTPSRKRQEWRDGKGYSWGGNRTLVHLPATSRPQLAKLKGKEMSNIAHNTKKRTTSKKQTNKQTENKYPQPLNV